MSKPTDIIMTTYNRIDLTKKSLESILARTESDYRLIVVDNGSTDGTLDYLRKLEKEGKIFMLVENGENLGLERALQIGFSYVRSGIFVTVDNDCIAPRLSPDWLSTAKHLMSLPQYKKFAAVSLRPQVLIGVGPIFNSEELIVENNVCGGSYRVMKTEVVKEAGGWTRQLLNDGRGKEEWDICGKLKNNGHKVGYFRELWTYHQWGDENWGYKNVSSRMGRMIEKAPKDQEYNFETCEPKIRSNE